MAALTLTLDLWRSIFISLHQRTPLHVAAYRGNVETVAFLVDKGADMSIKNENGVSE